MGSVLAVNGLVKLKASVFGTDAIESLELFRGREVMQTVRPTAFENVGSSKHIRLRWRGSRIRGRGRRVNWDGTIRVEGARIVSTSGFFDTPIDRITAQDEHQVTFVSQTTGDADGVDLVLDRADRGTIRFESKAGNCQVELAELTGEQPRRSFDFGGLDMAVQIERYPESVTDQTAVLETTVSAQTDKPTPYFVKVTQCDGQMAWSSPIYLRQK